MEVSQTSLWIVVVLVLVALAFDFMNGFHDAANSIATVVSTRVLKPYQAPNLAPGHDERARRAVLARALTGLREALVSYEWM